MRPPRRARVGLLCAFSAGMLGGAANGNGWAILAGLGFVAAALVLLVGSGWPDPSPPSNPTRDRLDAFGRASARSRRDIDQ